MSRKPILALAMALLPLAIAGCSRSAEPMVASDTNIVGPAPVEASPVAHDAPVESANAASPIDADATQPEAPAVTQAPDAQIEDDATASGMTTRAARGEASANEFDLPARLEED